MSSRVSVLTARVWKFAPCFTRNIFNSSVHHSNEDSWLNKIFVRTLEPVKESQSDLLSDHNSVYELQFHSVKPEKMAEYLTNFKQLHDMIDQRNSGAELCASWTVDIGDQDDAVHLWRYAGGYPTLDKHQKIYRSEDFALIRKERNELLRSRSNHILLPFSFWPTIAPRSGPNIYELRCYTLKSGAMIEWGNYWARGIKFRQEDGEAVAGLFSHIGHMHVVYHIFAYRDLEHRKTIRDNAWRSPGWDECVLHTVPLIRHMKCQILRPGPMSPCQ